MAATIRQPSQYRTVEKRDTPTIPMMKIDAVIAANRFGLGARPGELAAIDPNPRRWLLDQLQGPSRLPAAFGDLPQSQHVIDALGDLRRERKAERQKEAPSRDIVRRYAQTVKRHFSEQVDARYRLATTTDAPFHERLVQFWTNHFAISADKQPIPAVAGLFEVEVIRPNITGRFADLLLAVEKHPAMLLYLDNSKSVGPNSTLGKRARRRSRERTIGLNENLAREILELHTLGVDGGYTQDDVTTFANVITGWSIGGTAESGRFTEGTPGTFEFRESIHEPGTKTLLGKRYRQSGVAQGEAVLRDLAVHPSTAKFLTTKLARHFVADAPSDALVAALTDAYLDSGGNLSVVYEALINAEDSFSEPLSKYKTPNDFLISTFRALGREPEDIKFVVGALELMGQTPYKPGSPAGWPDTADQWGGADALYKRIEWSNTVAQAVGTAASPLALGDSALGPNFSASTRRAVSRAESTAQGLTLLLASPDFQRR